jgi:triosephosphate isomerase
MAPRDVHEMTIYIKKMLTDLYKVKTRVSIPILYGGAVDPLNARALLADGEADGFLVGRQSLDPKNFLEIIRSA